MGGFWGTVISLLVILSAGRLLFEIKYISIRDQHPGIKLPVYFMAGSAVISAYMFALFLAHVNYSVLSIGSPFFLYLIYYFCARYGTFAAHARAAAAYFSGLANEAKLRENRLFILICAFFALVIAVITVENLIMPVYLGDAYIHWFFKAKALFSARTIPLNILTDNIYYYSALDYPLLISSNIAWMSLCIGKWIDTYTKTLFTLQYVAAATFFYFSLKQIFKLDKVSYMAITFIVFTVPHVIGDITTGYVDVSMGFYVLFAMTFFYRWLENKSSVNFLCISALFIGAAANTKNDGILLLLAMALTFTAAIVMSIAAKKLALDKAVMLFFIFAVIAAVVFLPFKMWVVSHKIENHMIVSASQLLNISDSLRRIPIIFKFYLYELFLDTYQWMYFWIFSAVLIILNWKTMSRSNAGYLFMFVILSIVGYFCVYMVTALGNTPARLMDNLELSFDRVLLGIAPTAGLLLADFARKK